jgi:hypothetical protein
MQKFYCVSIRCRYNVYTEPLPSNDREIHIVGRVVFYEIRVLSKQEQELLVFNYITVVNS